MAERASSKEGFVQLIQRLGESFLNLIHNRTELFALEVKEEKTRLLLLLIWAGMALILTIVALLVATATIIVFCPPDARRWVLLGFGILYLLAASFTFLGFRNRLRKHPTPFHGTLEQLKKDRECLQRKH